MALFACPIILANRNLTRLGSRWSYQAESLQCSGVNVRMPVVPTSMSLPSARALLLAAQGIEPGPAAPATKNTVLKSIRRMGQLQIDTISVANRSP